MKKEKVSDVNTHIAPVVDSQNPPISVDWVTLGDANSPSGARVFGFFGRPFILKEEVSELNGQEHKVVHVRPVCVVDLSAAAMNSLMSFSLARLESEVGKFEAILKMYPELKAKLKEKLPEIKKILEA